MDELPSYAAFKAAARPGAYYPFVKKINYFDSPSEIYRRCSDLRSPSVLLESARVDPRTGGTSIIAKNPFLIFESKGRSVRLKTGGVTKTVKADPLNMIKKLLRQHAVISGEMPLFSGGAIGYFGYEVKDLIEKRRSSKVKQDLGLPDIYLLFFDEGVVVDHAKRCVFLFSNSRVGSDLKRSHSHGLNKIKKLEKHFFERVISAKRRFPKKRPVRSQDAQAIQSSLTRNDFVHKVQAIKEHIQKGDIFQANLSQRFDFAVSRPPFEIYETLKKVNPSPFFAYLDAVDFQIICGSPERLVKLEDGLIQTRPIAGTRSRGKTALEDAQLSRDLALSEKERAEHIMLVDLERNDMGRVAEYGSVATNELMAIEDYSHVKHMVSNVQGTLRQKLDAVDVLKAFFPGGTITGAPKVRCMEILDELEPAARGPYTGSLGYLGFNANMDLNIIIRSLVVKGKIAYLQVGAGIVADSIAEKEYDETLYKAEAVLKALFGEEKTGAFFARCRRGL